MTQTSIQSLEKIAKTSEDTKKLLGKLTKLNNQISKKDDTQTTKLSSLVRKVADSEFTPTFLQKFLQKPNEEGNDLSARLEKNQNNFIGSFVTLFKNREAKEAATLGITRDVLREFKKDNLSQEEIITNLNLQKEKENELLSNQTKTEEIERFDSMAEGIGLNTEVLDKFLPEQIVLLKLLNADGGKVKDILQTTEEWQGNNFFLLEKLLESNNKFVDAGSSEGSLFVHDINTEKGLDKVINFNEQTIEMAKDKMRKDDISALQDKEDKKQLLNATKSGGMGAAGGAGAGIGVAGESGSGMGGISKLEALLLFDKIYPWIKKTGKSGRGSIALAAIGIDAAIQLFQGKNPLGILKDYMSGGILMKMLTDSPYFINKKKQEDKDAKFKLDRDAAKAADLLQEKNYLKSLEGASPYTDYGLNMQLKDNYLLDDLKDKYNQGPMDYFNWKDMDNQGPMDYLKRNDRKIMIPSLSISNLDNQTDILLAEINKKGENRVPTIVSSVQDNKNINNIRNESSTVFGVRVVDESRRVFV